MRFRDFPIKRKLVGVIVLTSLAVLGFTSASLVMYERYSYEQSMRRSLTTIADIIAANSTAVLIYDDQKLAAEILAGLRAEPEITAAALFDQQGRLYATYPARTPADRFPSAPNPDGFRFERWNVRLWHPVIEGQNRVGTLFLQADLVGMYRRLAVFGMVVLTVALGAGVIAVFLSNFFHRLISQPILGLAQTARAISDQRDYSVRAVKLSNDEIGGLTEAFNVMLDQIQASHSALRTSEERLSAVFQQAGVGIAQTDLSGRFLMVNDRYCEIMGRPREVLLGIRLQDLVHPADLGQTLFLTAQAAKNSSAFVLQTRYDRPQGGSVWVRNSVAFIRNAQGRVDSAINVTEDITASKQTELELERARDDAVASSRAKDDFLARLSHELRTPLNPVLLLASEAAEDSALTPEIRADFATIRNNVELEARLIDDLLDLTRITRGKLLLELRPHDLHTVIRDALATVRGELDQKRIVPLLSLDAPPPVVMGDAVRLQQVFWNVLRNAVKFTPDGGRITLETQLTPDGSQVEATIADTGIGVEPDELNRIFDAFSQGDHATATGSHTYGGIGLGLAISRMLVELHHGTIRAASEGRGRGARFIIALPVCGQETVATPQPASVIPATPGPSRVVCAKSMHGRVLLIEDHVPTRSTLQHLLQRRGYEVLAAGSVAEARAAVAGKVVDFVISDIGLPDGNAYDLMSELRNERGLTGIALTGYGMESDIARSHAAGFVMHLTKPLRVQSLDEALAKLTGEASGA